MSKWLQHASNWQTGKALQLPFEGMNAQLAGLNV